MSGDTLIVVKTKTKQEINHLASSDRPRHPGATWSESSRRLGPSSYEPMNGARRKQTGVTLTADFLARQVSHANRPEPDVLRLFGGMSPTRDWLLSLEPCELLALF